MRTPLSTVPSPKGHWPCLCGSGAAYRACCRPWHLGGEPQRAEQLMRARFTAFAWGKVSFLMRTTHPLHPDARTDRDAWWMELSQAILEIRYDHLVVLAAKEEPEKAEVTFAASGLRGSARMVHREKSLFVRVGAAWRYRDGVVEEAVGQRRQTKVPEAVGPELPPKESDGCAQKDA